MKRGTSFKKVVLCHTDDFKPSINDKIKVWVEANGGVYVKQLSPEVTHLVASKQAWKQYHPLVKQARRSRTIRIVKYDWLEDSLLKRPVRALPVDEYLFEQTKLKPIKKARNMQGGPEDNDSNNADKVTIPRDKRIELAGVEFDKARRDFELDMKTAGFHPYFDRTGFVYIVTLLRYDILRSRFEKYKLKVGHDPPSIPHEVVPKFYTRLHLFPIPEPFSTAPVVGVKLSTSVKRSSCIHIAEPWAQCLQLYESDMQPYTYACYAQYTRVGTPKQIYVLAPPGSTWDFTWSMFQNWFLRKVGTTWNERPNNGIEINLDGDNGVPWFRYQAPRVGDPEGLRASVENPSWRTPASTNQIDEQTPVSQHDKSDNGLLQYATSVELEAALGVDDTHLP